MAWSTNMRAESPSPELKIEQVTSGPKHHFFGYIGQCQTIPWNAGGRYGRLARLRLVTGYPGALDWSRDDNAPDNDGIFVVDIKTGKRRVLVSYRRLADLLKQRNPNMEDTALFINHTLWNRRGDHVYFFVRAGWNKRGARINTPCSIHIDGTGLTLHDMHIGGHPEWAEDDTLIGRQGDDQILYDVVRKKVVGRLGTPEIFPKPEGDVSLSPNGKWFVNGYKKGNKNHYVVYRLSDGVHALSEGLDKGRYGGDIRIDPAPRWNRTNDAILVPGIAKDGTRQMFVIRVRSDPGTD